MSNVNAYHAGTNGKEGQDFIDDFLSEENSALPTSEAVVLALMKTEEIDAVVDEMIKPQMEDNPTIAVEDRGGYWWIKANGKIVIDCDEATELLGKKYTVYDLLVNVSTTVGRAMTLGNQFIITNELLGLETKVESVY
ncbi:MmoB/DmpM family protein [Thauera butanivorans]|uniref:Butane monooxygenase regulatory protein n=1 Tax=Thauera butanivorans TaxID=86174 RepID=Q8KQE8_9RHOO|nr:MmoB/DmpM family protein [Thauera butanivorans]AAM19729.1 butane monooxygenase regulatory protein [Thauera butanivorans]